MKAMSMKCCAVCFSAALIVLLGSGCDKKSPVEKVAQKSNNAAQKAGDAVKDTATKAKDAVKDTAQKAVDAGKEGVQKATTIAANVAAKTKDGAQKVESAVTNFVGEIKQKVQ